MTVVFLGTTVLLRCDSFTSPALIQGGCHERFVPREPLQLRHNSDSSFGASLATNTWNPDGTLSFDGQERQRFWSCNAVSTTLDLPFRVARPGCGRSGSTTLPVLNCDSVTLISRLLMALRHTIHASAFGAALTFVVDSGELCLRTLQVVLWAGYPLPVGSHARLLGHTGHCLALADALACCVRALLTFVVRSLLLRHPFHASAFGASSINRICSCECLCFTPGLLLLLTVTLCSGCLHCASSTQEEVS